MYSCMYTTGTCTLYHAFRNVKAVHPFFAARSHEKERHCAFELRAACPTSSPIPGWGVPMGVVPPPNFLARSLTRGIAQPHLAPERAHCVVPTAW